MPRFNKSVFAGRWASGGPCPGAGALGGAYVSETPVGSILWVKRVSSAVRLRFSPDGAGQTLGRVLRSRVLGWYGARARRKSRPGGNRLGASRGWDGGRLPRAGRVGGPSRCGSLTVREVSFGGVWPGSRIRYDEGGHSGRFRLGGLGLVQSRREVSALPQHEGYGAGAVGYHVAPDILPARQRAVGTAGFLECIAGACTVIAGGLAQRVHRAGAIGAARRGVVAALAFLSAVLHRTAAGRTYGDALAGPAGPVCHVAHVFWVRWLHPAGPAVAAGLELRLGCGSCAPEKWIFRSQETEIDRPATPTIRSRTEITSGSISSTST